VVLRARQHLAAVMPVERLLVLNTLRFANELRPVSKLELPGNNLKAVGVSPKELDMAARLVADMTEPWDPKAFKDTYRADLLRRIEDKVKSGRTHEVSEPGEEHAPRRSAQVIDLMSLLKQSLDAKDERASSHRPRRAAARGHASRSRRSPEVDRRRRRA
jgi:DNA end-binding protein Ku